MPNGGSDCCGTCWFNAKNAGKAGLAMIRVPGASHCTIRDLPIKNAAYTYCANHPHRFPEPMPVPVGPVTIGDSAGKRAVWVDSPDTDEIRANLLALLHAIDGPPGAEYPIGPAAGDVVIWQLGEFREARATPDLERIIGFDPGVPDPNALVRDRRTTIALARGALEKIVSGSREPVTGG